MDLTEHGASLEGVVEYLVEELGWPWNAPAAPKPPRSITDAIGEYLWGGYSDYDTVNRIRERFTDDRYAFLDWLAEWTVKPREFRAPAAAPAAAPPTDLQELS